ncbi:MAG: GGDEF domain-containing protein [Phycisphaerae bacterium]|nr:GGDEF domain-containing protein [Phycisphaerae bacterium]
MSTLPRGDHLSVIASSGVGSAEGLPGPSQRGLSSLHLPVWARAVVLIVGVAACTGATVITGETLGFPLRQSVILSLPAGAAVGFLFALLLVLMPEWRAAADRRWLVECLADVSRVDREQRFSALLAHGEDHELHELAKAIHAAMLSAHRDRLEAAGLRRELDARVHRRTKAAVAELHRLSNTDELTQLRNRRGFEGAFAGLFDLAAATGEELALLAIDLDHFKQLNDACGHQVGDSALRAAGEVMLTQLREGDLAGRIGGDEFVIALRGTGAPQAHAVARRLIDLYSRCPAALGVASQWPTFSIGIACAGEHRAEGPEHLRRMADQALYAAKRAGRAEAMVYSPSAPKVTKPVQVEKRAA